MLDLKFFCVSIYIDGASRQAVKTSDCGSDMRGFESHLAPHNKNKHPLWVRFLFVWLG